MRCCKRVLSWLRLPMVENKGWSLLELWVIHSSNESPSPARSLQVWHIFLIISVSDVSELVEASSPDSTCALAELPHLLECPWTPWASRPRTMKSSISEVSTTCCWCWVEACGLGLWHQWHHRWLRHSLGLGVSPFHGSRGLICQRHCYAQMFRLLNFQFDELHQTTMLDFLRRAVMACHPGNPHLIVFPEFDERFATVSWTELTCHQRQFFQSHRLEHHLGWILPAWELGSSSGGCWGRPWLSTEVTRKTLSRFGLWVPFESAASLLIRSMVTPWLWGITSLTLKVSMIWLGLITAESATLLISIKNKPFGVSSKGTAPFSMGLRISYLSASNVHLSARRREFDTKNGVAPGTMAICNKRLPNGTTSEWVASRVPWFPNLKVMLHLARCSLLRIWGSKPAIRSATCWLPMTVLVAPLSRTPHVPLEQAVAAYTNDWSVISEEASRSIGRTLSGDGSFLTFVDDNTCEKHLWGSFAKLESSTKVSLGLIFYDSPFQFH